MGGLAGGCQDGVCTWIELPVPEGCSQPPEAQSSSYKPLPVSATVLSVLAPALFSILSFTLRPRYVHEDSVTRK